MVSRRMRSALWTGLLALCAASAAMAQTSVVLRPSAGVAAGADSVRSPAVTLADIAEIDPPTTPEAMKLRDIVVVAPGGVSCGSMDVPISQVRSAMDAAGVKWARVALRGSACRVTIGAETPEPTGAKAPPRVSLSQATAQPVDLNEPDIRAVISGRLVDLYNVAPEDLRLAFDGGDEAFLSQRAGGGDRRVDVQPTSGGASARTTVNVFIYEGDRLIQTRLVATQALINRAVVTARAPIERGQAIGSDMVEVGRQWLAPNAKASPAPDQVIGQLAAKAIASGAVVTASDVTAPIVCKRGDIVWVHALSGAVNVRAKARALGPARDGETVQLKLDGSDRVFSARMSGPGKAVMIVKGPTGDGGAAAPAADQPAEGDRAQPPLRVAGTTYVRPVRTPK